MEDFFKKVDKRAAESAEEVMRKYSLSLKETVPASIGGHNSKNQEG